MGSGTKKSIVVKLVPIVLLASFGIVVVVTTLLVLSLRAPLSTEDGASLYVQFLKKGLELRLLQIVDGIVLGFACIYLGVATCWEGVMGAFEIEASSDQGKVAFKSAGAGALVVVAGAILVYGGTNSRGVEMTAPRTIRTGVESTNGQETTTIEVPESISF